jgi:hypothetical protein
VIARLVRRWASTTTRAENARLRAELRNVRRAVKDMRHAHHTLTRVAAIRSLLIAELRDELAAVKAQQGEPK